MAVGVFFVFWKGGKIVMVQKTKEGEMKNQRNDRFKPHNL